MTRETHAAAARTGSPADEPTGDVDNAELVRADPTRVAAHWGVRVLAEDAPAGTALGDTIDVAVGTRDGRSWRDRTEATRVWPDGDLRCQILRPEPFMGSSASSLRIVD